MEEDKSRTGQDDPAGSLLRRDWILPVESEFGLDHTGSRIVRCSPETKERAGLLRTPSHAAYIEVAEDRVGSEGGRRGWNMFGEQPVDG
jgi:hypothetical protein